ncbi:MAG: septum formation initiator family protein [Muribaculaceae bacterium]|nr:septum formation initiator family protein [Muribaculaceae bacterium]
MNENENSPRPWVKRFLPLPTIIILCLAAYILFVGDNSLVSRMRYEHTIDSLRVELEAQRDTMLYYQRLNENLVHDPEVMEHVVREQYNMKRDNEDVFVFETPQPK